LARSNPGDLVRVGEKRDENDPIGTNRTCSLEICGKRGEERKVRHDGKDSSGDCELWGEGDGDRGGM
jgi:hypothetical protein